MRGSARRYVLGGVVAVASLSACAEDRVGSIKNECGVPLNVTIERRTLRSSDNEFRLDDEATITSEDLHMPLRIRNPRTGRVTTMQIRQRTVISGDDCP
jgi:hypothetical protein